MAAIPRVCPSCYRQIDPKAVIWKFGQVPYCPGCHVAMVQTHPTRRADLERADYR